MRVDSVEGIVLQKIDYSDTSIIVKVLTREEGVLSFIFPGGKSKKKSGNLIHPLAILQITFSKANNRDLATIKEISPSVVWKEIPFNPYKTSILFFLAEVLNLTVREQEDNEGLYEFVKNALQVLDLTEHTKNFPVIFLIQLTNYLGFYPKLSDEPKYFDFSEGSFVPLRPAHMMYAGSDTSATILRLMKCRLDGNDTILISSSERKAALYEMLNYYRVLFDHFREVQTLSVLEAVLHD